MTEDLNDKEELILKNLFDNPDFAKKVAPFLKANYFDHVHANQIIKNFTKHVDEFKDIPNVETLLVRLKDDKENSDVVETVKFFSEFTKKPKGEFQVDFLMKETERYFQYVSLSKAIIWSSGILQMPNDLERLRNKDKIPEKIREALKVSFDNDVGREYLTEEEIVQQYQHYHNAERKYSFPRWKHMTDIYQGGVSKKKLHVIMSTSGVGKTTWLVNIAEQYISLGLDVLYITLEIAEEEIVERIDANLLQKNTKDLIFISEKDYSSKLKAIKQKGYGRLFVKEYPPASINVDNIRFYMEELKIKHDFTPTVLIVDYLNLLMSSRFKNAGETYSYVKGVNEELRGLCVEKEMVGWSATQGNRSAYNNSNPGMENTSDSMGTAFAADVLLMLIETDENKANNQHTVKQLKNRYSPIYPSNMTWLVNVDKEQQRITELDNYDTKESGVDDAGSQLPIANSARPMTYQGKPKPYQMPNQINTEGTSNSGDFQF